MSHTFKTTSGAWINFFHIDYISDKAQAARLICGKQVSLNDCDLGKAKKKYKEFLSKQRATNE